MTYDDLGRTALLVLPDSVLELTDTTEITFEVVVTEVAYSESFSNATMTKKFTATVVPVDVVAVITPIVAVIEDEPAEEVVAAVVEEVVEEEKD